jgi:hypothetical protein
MSLRSTKAKQPKSKVLEYTAFQPGLFTNYFSYPYLSAAHLSIPQLYMDFESRRFIVIGDGSDSIFTLTTVQDLAKVVAAAISYEGKWPRVGGIKADTISVKELIELGTKIRGA